MNYIGEHLIFGLLGKTFLTSSIAFLLFSLFLYIYKNGSLRKYARLSFILHFITLVFSSFLLFYIIYNRYFEYKYVWQYSSLGLPFKYVISGFWAGQEGSFLVWAFWQALLGIVLLWSSKELERYVVPIVIIAQLFVLSMVSGFSFLGLQIGSSPFILLRETVEDIKGTIFSQPNYLELLGDGNGLNPLLENVWMISHPPVLFLGYAATLIPYAFAFSFLINGNNLWESKAYRWVIFSQIALGCGLILGGRWAYESLTFGGFWAWDPVENASLVPWLVLLAGQHLMLVAKSNKTLSKYSAIVLISSFVLVIYSSFLTRSGILGSSSVHSFSNNGTYTLFLFFLGVFVLLPIIASSINKKQQFILSFNFSFNDRNFWLIIFVFALLLSAFQILLTTSLPVIGKILGINFAPPQNFSGFYAKWQIPFAILFCILLIINNLIFSFKQLKFKFYFSICLIACLLVTYLLSVYYNINDFLSILLMLFSLLILFSVFYSFRNNSLAANMTHLGAGLFFVGIILAFNNPQNLVKKDKGIYADILSDQGHITLMKDTLVDVEKYFLMYSKKEKINNETFYHVDFFDRSLNKRFTLKPSVNENNNFGNVFNPSTKHLFSSDIFTHLVSVEQNGDYKLLKETEVKLYDSVKFDSLFLYFNKIKVKQPENDTNISNVEIFAEFFLRKSLQVVDTIQIMYIVEDGFYRSTSDFCLQNNYKIVFKGLSEKENTIAIQIFKQTKDVIVIKSTIFSFISLLWIGTILIIGGLLLALMKKSLKPSLKTLNS